MSRLEIMIKLTDNKCTLNKVKITLCLSKVKFVCFIMSTIKLFMISQEY